VSAKNNAEAAKAYQWQLKSATRADRRFDKGLLDLSKASDLSDYMCLSHLVWREENFEGRNRRHVEKSLNHFVSARGRSPYHPGDHLKTPRKAFLDLVDYTHHGIYLGRGTVIHYYGLTKKNLDARITITSLDKFSDGQDIQVVYSPAGRGRSAAQVNAVLIRALWRLSEREYNVYGNNCEDFSLWCISGRASRKSPQGRKLSTARSWGEAAFGAAVGATFGPVVLPFLLALDIFSSD
jgi:hypothetical protein